VTSFISVWNLLWCYSSFYYSIHLFLVFTSLTCRKYISFVGDIHYYYEWVLVLVLVFVCVVIYRLKWVSYSFWIIFLLSISYSWNLYKISHYYYCCFYMCLLTDNLYIYILYIILLINIIYSRPYSDADSQKSQLHYPVHLIVFSIIQCLAL